MEVLHISNSDVYWQVTEIATRYHCVVQTNYACNVYHLQLFFPFSVQHCK